MAVRGRGLLWNLEAGDGRVPRLSFARAGWPEPPADGGFRRLLPFAVPLVLFAATVLVGSVRWKV